MKNTRLSEVKTVPLFWKIRFPSSWVAWLILVTSLCMTLGVWKAAQKNGREAATAQFDARSGDVITQIRQRMQAYEYLLRGGAALFVASKSVERNEWRDFVAGLKIDQHLTGIHGVGFAKRISVNEKERHIARVRAEGFPSYTVTPEGLRSEYAPVVFLEPFSESNLRAFGYDMFSEPVRRAAMEQARDTDDIAISGMVTLIQETKQGVQPGFLMYLPVYRNGQPHQTRAERRAALEGYVYSPFRMNELMEGIVGKSIPNLGIHIYDGEGTSASALMYQSLGESRTNRKKTQGFSNTASVIVGGHLWTVYTESLPSFDDDTAKKTPAIILIAGLLISCLLFMVARIQEISRKSAMTLADEMTQAYKASELHLQAILDNSPYIAWLKDTTGRYLKVNKPYVSYLQRQDAEQIIGKTDLDLWPKELAEKYRLDDAEVMVQRQQKHIEEPSLEGNEMHWVKIFKSPVIDEQGHVLGITGFIHDITERKNKEVKIVRLSRAYRLLSRVNEAIVRAQDRAELFTAICEAAVESDLFRLAWIGILDEDRISVSPIAYAGVNEGYTDKLNIRLDDERTGQGPTATALRNGTHAVCQDIRNDPGMLPWRDDALKRGYRSTGQFSIREAGAVVGTINTYAGEVNFFTPDIIQLMLELVTDVSFALDVFVEKKRREQAESELKQLNLELESRVLERTRQLEVANEELEAFSYSVSHDLRAPLRSIDGFSQILATKYQAQLDVTGNDYLQRVRRSSQRMGHLIDDLLRLSQVSRSSLRCVQLDLSAMAESVTADLPKAAPGRQVHFDLQPGLSAYADPGLLRIVMTNLLGNANKFTGKKTHAKIEFGLCEHKGESSFFVRDNGEGFNMGYAHKLFGAFQRLHGANEFEGTGIGLATVKRIIQRHHGKVWAEGKEGLGATFYFTLPPAIHEKQGKK